MGKLKNNWIFSYEALPVYPMCVCLDEEDWKLALKDVGTVDPANYKMWCTGMAYVHYFENSNFGVPAFILCFQNWKTLDRISLESYIVHECTHVKQFFLEYICEDRISREVEAYLMQYIFKVVCEEFERKRKKLENKVSGVLSSVD